MVFLVIHDLAYELKYRYIRFTSYINSSFYGRKNIDPDTNSGTKGLNAGRPEELDD